MRGILAAVLSSALGGMAAAVTRFAVPVSDPVTLILGEPIGWSLVAGIVAVAAGIYIASTPPGRSRSARPGP